MFGLGFQELLLILGVPMVLALGLLVYILTHPRFLGSLLDFSFTEFVTAQLIRFLYGFGLVLAGLIAVIAIVRAFRDSFQGGLVALVGSFLLLLVYAVLSRVWFELLIVVFRIVEHTAEIAGRKHVAEEPATRRAGAEAAVAGFCHECGAPREGVGRFCQQCGAAYA